jgi:mono/diheme cytochrome c family protein
MKRQLLHVLLAAMLLALFASAGDHATLLKRASDAARREANPYQGQPQEIRAGAKLFQHHCASCHGENALGIGKAPSLISKEVQDAEPGALSWVLRNGSRATGMPSFSKLPEQQRWQIITWLGSANGHPQ